MAKALSPNNIILPYGIGAGDRSTTLSTTLNNVKQTFEEYTTRKSREKFVKTIKFTYLEFRKEFFIEQLLTISVINNLLKIEPIIMWYQ